MRRALACDQAVLGPMTAKGVDDLRALAHQQVAGPEHDGRGLLGLALDGDEPHSRALGRLADRFGIRGIVLLPRTSALTEITPYKWLDSATLSHELEPT